MERPCFDTFQSLNQSPHTRFKRDGITRRFGLIPLPPKPFNHLSVVAYLAIGVVVLASSLVAGYLVYSCYHSARGKGVEQNTTLRNEDFRDTELGIYEKDEIINDLELRRFEFQHSESKVNFQTVHIFLCSTFFVQCNIRASDIVDSQVFFENESNVAHHDPVNCPQLAHISDRPATFHLPPPPSSPSPAHKQHVRRYAGDISSPVSPSPSFFPDDPPSAVLTSISPLEGDLPNSGRHLADAKQQVRVPQFDLKDIRYIPTLDAPVTTESTVKSYEESRFLPAKNSTTTFVSPGDDHTRPSQGAKRSLTALPCGTRATTPPTRPGPTESETSGERSATAAPGRRLAQAEIDTENVNPILNHSHKNRWGNVPLLAPTHLKPGPGFF